MIYLDNNMRLDELKVKEADIDVGLTRGMYNKALKMIDQRLNAGDQKARSVKNRLIQNWDAGDRAINKFDKELLSAGIKMADLK